MSRSETEYLRHIQDEARYLADASREVSWDEFSDDGTLNRAFVRSIEVIGELQRTSQRISEIGTQRSTGGRWLECVTG